MNRIVFLLEERSMKVLLDGLLPRLLPGIRFLCVPHEGKQDLVKSIPRKLKVWQEPGVRFVVVQDNDGGDCRTLKQQLVDLCEKAERNDALVRIAVQELEAWYFGDPNALARAFGNESLVKIGNKARYRDPDVIVKPSRELKKWVPEFQKISGARKMAQYLEMGTNRSLSFQMFLKGVERIISEVGEDHGENESRTGR